MSGIKRIEKQLVGLKYGHTKTLVAHGFSCGHLVNIVQSFGAKQCLEFNIEVVWNGGAPEVIVTHGESREHKIARELKKLFEVWNCRLVGTSYPLLNYLTELGERLSWDLEK